MREGSGAGCASTQSQANEGGRPKGETPTDARVPLPFWMGFPVGLRRLNPGGSETVRLPRLPTWGV